MSVKHALLALLDQGPRHGYGLKHEFEARLGQSWPLNVGQVYSTLARLERDGLVAPGARRGTRTASGGPSGSPGPGGPRWPSGCRRRCPRGPGP